MAHGPALSPAALSLHREATVVDLHNDLMLEVQAAKRDITIRSSTGHSDLPRLREGGVDGQCFALFVHPKEADRGFARVTELLDAFERLAAANDDVLGRATTVAEIERLQQAGRLAVVLAIENGSALGDDLHHLDAVYERGADMSKVMGPDHVALGSEFDGFDGRVSDLEDVARLPNLTAGLLARGFDARTITQILGGNALRVFRDVWGR